MAALTTLLAGASLLVGAVGVASGIEGRKEAAAANASAAEEGHKAQSEQAALNAQNAALERRSQIREERVRRAKILQSAQNTGVADSSGEAGALGSLSTQLSTNIGINAGREEAGIRIGGYMQNAADFNTAAQRASLNAQSGDQLFGLGMSIFNAAGGASAFKSK